MAINERFCIGEQIEFADEDGIYTIQAIGPRYAVLTRPYDGDDPDQPPDQVWYTIIDSQTFNRGRHDRIFNFHDVKTIEGCEQLLSDLESGELELSRRYVVPVQLVGDEEL